jgi:hypothetical protein
MSETALIIVYAVGGLVALIGLGFLVFWLVREE